MATTITLELPEELLREALRRLPSERRRTLVSKLEAGPWIQARRVPAEALDRLTGLISVGGDAREYVASEVSEYEINSKKNQSGGFHFICSIPGGQTACGFCRSQGSVQENKAQLG